MRWVNLFTALHAIRGILLDRALLAKSTLTYRTNAAVRVTTSQTDFALGLSDYVHFYLLHSMSQWKKVPILAAQLLNGNGAPFPHVAIEMTTQGLLDDKMRGLSLECGGEPSEGGQSLQGRQLGRALPLPKGVLQIWRLFKQQNPDVQKARGHWNHPIQTPTLRGDQIGLHLHLMNRAPRGMPELLLTQPVAIDSRFRLWTFSPDDLQALNPLREMFKASRIDTRIYSLNGYDSQSADTRRWCERTESHFRGTTAFSPELDFDRRR